MNWSNLAGFLMVAVPAIMIATHISAGVIGMVRRSLVMAQARQIVCDAMAVKEHEDDKRKDAATLEAKPYITHDEYYEDLVYGNLDVVVRRSWRGIPPGKDILDARKALATAREKLAKRDTSQ